ncbi:MAG: hypothetical protein SCH39_11040 [Methanosarcinales archaeon]|nr:hypothetical protein [Methanosarcinales archaeon]
MTLFVSKLSLGNAGNPVRPKIYDSIDCKSYGEDEYVTILEEDEEVEIIGDEDVIEDYDEDEIKEHEEEMKRLKENLIEEFRDGRLRQGWGYEDGVFSMNLKIGNGSFYDENGRIQPEEGWICSFMNLYCKSQEEAVGRFRILSRLLDMEKDDIVFVPNIPSDDMFSVATVDEGYEFKLMKDYNGHGHIIHVRDIEEYYYGDDTLPKKLWSFPPAVVRIRKEDEFKKFLDKSYFK